MGDELIEIHKPVLEQATRISLRSPKYGAGVDLFNALIRQIDRKDHPTRAERTADHAHFGS